MNVPTLVKNEMEGMRQSSSRSEEQRMANFLLIKLVLVNSQSV